MRSNNKIINPFSQLPNPITQYIFTFFSRTELVRPMQVAKNWQRFIQHHLATQKVATLCEVLKNHDLLGDNDEQQPDRHVRISEQLGNHIFNDNGVPGNLIMTALKERYPHFDPNCPFPGNCTSLYPLPLYLLFAETPCANQALQACFDLGFDVNVNYQELSFIEHAAVWHNIFIVLDLISFPLTRLKYQSPSSGPVEIKLHCYSDLTHEPNNREDYHNSFNVFTIPFYLADVFCLTVLNDLHLKYSEPNKLQPLMLSKIIQACQALKPKGYQQEEISFAFTTMLKVYNISEDWLINNIGADNYDQLMPEWANRSPSL